jgi:hypothetical protein
MRNITAELFWALWCLILSLFLTILILLGGCDPLQDLQIQYSHVPFSDTIDAECTSFDTDESVGYSCNYVNNCQCELECIGDFELDKDCMDAVDLLARCFSIECNPDVCFDEIDNYQKKCGVI